MGLSSVRSVRIAYFETKGSTAGDAGRRSESHRAAARACGIHVAAMVIGDAGSRLAGYTKGEFPQVHGEGLVACAHAVRLSFIISILGSVAGTISPIYFQAPCRIAGLHLFLWNPFRMSIEIHDIHSEGFSVIHDGGDAG